MVPEATILIVDMGSQYTRVIERKLRESGFRSAVLSPDKAAGWMTKRCAKAIIISGGDKSVYDADAPQVPAVILEAGVPIFGICYGMQWLAHHFGGTVEHHADQSGFGPTKVRIGENDLFNDLETYEIVWASHGDSVITLPLGGYVIATDEAGNGIKAMALPHQKVWGVQFHPEVADTACGGKILLNFVADICGCEKDWSPANLVTEIRTSCTDPSMRVIAGFSGGVDSTTAVTIISPVLGDRLRCIIIDAGHLRAGEIEEAQLHAQAAGVELHIIEAETRFFRALRGIKNSERKRKIFGKLYHGIFLEEVAKFDATHVVQGTLATDLIESGATGGAVIKSHHNVGHDWGDLGHLEPLKALFKYEVRALAKELGLPDSVAQREPFPGPGLFLRMPGAVTKKRRDVIRWADTVVRDIVRKHPDTPEISQLVIYLNGIKIVGVKGDGRVYAEMVTVRPVTTIDFMTASSPIFSPDLMTEIMREVSRHSELVGVLFDFNPKPPRTTEAE